MKMTRDDIHDELLGTIPWHAQEEFREECWGAFVDVNGREIPLTVVASEQSEPPITFLRSLVVELRSNEESFRRKAAEQLLDVYNSDWRFYTDDEADITSDTFAQRLSLKAARVEYVTLDMKRHQAWAAMLTYDPADMFTEHAVVVFVSEELSVFGVVLE